MNEAMNKWFIQTEELVKGPFTAEDVQERLAKGEFRSSDLIWGPAQEEWRQVQWWTSNYANILAGVGQISPLQEWHYSINGQTHGPLGRAELMQALKPLKSLGDVLLWTSGMVAWAPVFEFQELLSEMGVSRRQFPRADIIGRAHLKTPNGEIQAELISVGEGGFGVALTSGVLPGQIFPAELHSVALREVVHAKVECRFINNGMTGFRFKEINAEHKNTIIHYVKQYLERADDTRAA